MVHHCQRRTKLQSKTLVNDRDHVYLARDVPAVRTHFLSGCRIGVYNADSCAAIGTLPLFFRHPLPSTSVTMSLIESRGPPLVPPRDDLTVPQFILDDPVAHPSKPPRQAEVPCFIDERSGKRAYLAEVRVPLRLFSCTACSYFP